MVQIQPVTVAATSLVIQVVLIIIAYGTLWLLSHGWALRQAAKDSYNTLNLWTIAALIVLCMGEDLYQVWAPLFGALTIPGIPRAYSFTSVFILDIIFISFLIVRTGGTKTSPFTSMLLLLPSLAIFLREPPARFLIYALVAGVLYWALLHKNWQRQTADFDRSAFDGPSREDQGVDDRATTWANLACLGLATLVGYVSRP